MLFKDNNRVEFRQLEIDNASLIEKVNMIIIRGWRHYHQLQYWCDGYKSVPAGNYTLSHNRDIVWDPHSIMKDEDKPSLHGPVLRRRGITEVATATCSRNERLKPKAPLYNWAIKALAVIVTVFGLAIAFSWVK